MSYADVYNYVQGLSLHVKRNEIKSRVLAVSGINRVYMAVSKMDRASCRGMYLSPRNSNHPLVAQFGGHVIVTARGLNRCWTRLVIFKELMHLLDNQLSAVDSGDKFDIVLSELSSASQMVLGVSEAFRSEHQAAWMALGPFCPESIRLKFKDDLMRGHVTPYGVALQLRMPELYVPILMSDSCEEEIGHLLK